MSSTFFGLELGTRALNASQIALNVVGNNTANINTPGYSRQVVTFQETPPYTTPDFSQTKPGQYGTGVTVAGIDRVRDQFIDQRVWAANAQQGSLSNLKDILGQVESAFNEPGDTGVGSALTKLYNSFADLSPNPQSGAVRATVINQAETLVNTFHSVGTALSGITPEIIGKIGVTVDSINQIASQVADLNKQIGISIAAGDTPNDLQDKRGQLIDQLSSYADIQVSQQKNPETGRATGELNINIGGFALVQTDTAGVLPKTTTTYNNTFGLTTAAGDTIPLRSGVLYGLVKATTLIAGYQSELDTLAYNTVNATNTQHKSGYALDGSTNNAFFTPLSSAQGAAASISVDQGILNDPNKIAAATPPVAPNPFAPGNGDNARALAGLTSATVIGNFSLNSYYNAKVASIGADSQTVQQQASSQDAVVSQLKNQQSSVSGVNLDEELTRMMQYQRSYQAAARVINMADSFLNQIINGLGAGSGPTG